MKFIERIEIHRFRSIGDESVLASDINIFSGVNNSGKSNILRALNLFFNNQTSYDSPFDFNKDYNKAFTGQAGGAREIKITLHFLPQGTGALQDSFSITRSFRLDVSDVDTTYHSTNPSTQLLIDKNNGNIKRQFTRFLNSIKYFYIPAVRDKRFVRHLFLNFEQIVTDKSGVGLEEKLQQLSAIISDRSEAISTDFEQFLKLPTKATISSDMQDILGSIRVNVDSGLQILKKSSDKESPSKITPVFVDLFSSGDGVLMSYLAYFLAHLCRETPGTRYIWGFEEPENSLEYSKVQKLAEEFIEKFNKYAQIFLTTHSPAFVNLRHEEQVNFYRVYIEPSSDPAKANKRLTRIRTLEIIEKLQQSLFGDIEKTDEYIILGRELGMVEFSQEIESAAERLQAKIEEYTSKVTAVGIQLDVIARTYPSRVMIVEDSNKASIALWDILLHENGIDDVEIISSEGSTTNKIEEHLIQLGKIKPGYKPRVFRQIDRDGMTAEQVLYIETNLKATIDGSLIYQLGILPVNELENFALLLHPKAIDAWNANSEAIRDKFELTAESTAGKLSRSFRNAPEGLFRNSSSPTIVTQKMRAEALIDPVRLMPGKDIARYIPDYNPVRELKLLRPPNYPVELSDYISKVQKFFS